MKPIPLHPNMPEATSALGNVVKPKQWYECPHCNKPSPLTKEWHGLTEEEIKALRHTDDLFEDVPMWSAIARAIEAKLKERNT